MSSIGCKGIVLAGGLGTRLEPLTLATNKHLLPIYDVPMIFHPINTLVRAGIEDIMVVTSGPHAGDFISILKNGQDLGCHLYYGYQDKPDGGIADALSICREFAGWDAMCVILGDNTTDADISDAVEGFTSKVVRNTISSAPTDPCAHVFLKEVEDPERFGVAVVEGDQVLHIDEKPKKPLSNLAVTGLYLYDHSVWGFIDQCSPSQRGELEITDVNNLYIRDGILSHSMLDGFWRDAGTVQAMFEASAYWQGKGGLKCELEKLRR